MKNLYKHEEKVSLPEGVLLRRSPGSTFDKDKVEVLAQREDGVILGKALSRDLRTVYGRKKFESEIKDAYGVQRNKDIRENREIVELVQNRSVYGTDSMNGVKIIETNGYEGEFLGEAIEDNEKMHLQTRPISIIEVKNQWICFNFGWLKKSQILSLNWELNPVSGSKRLIRVWHAGDPIEKIEEEVLPSPNEIILRVTYSQRAAYEAEAIKAGESLAAWICRHLNNAAFLATQ